MAVTGVPFYRLELTKSEIDSVLKVLKSGWLTSGPICRQFEEEFAQYTGSPHAVAVNSCTAALHLSLVAAGVGPGDEVITSPYTFVASVEAILHAGAKPVFVDTEKSSFNLDLERVPDKITTRTKALMPVHIAGLPCDLRRLARLRREQKLIIVHDAAHALGAAAAGRQVGSTSDFTCFSFYATKNLTTGEGGMVTCSKRQADRVRLLSLHGMSKGAWGRYRVGGSWQYQIRELGYKYNLADLNAALGLAQLRRFERIQESRRQAVAWYGEYLRDVEELELPVEPQGVTHAWHLYIIQLRQGGERRRNQVIERLRQAGIGTSVHFIPLTLQPYYRKTFKLSPEQFPNALRHYQTAITLPLFAGLRKAEVQYVAQQLKRSLSQS
ncbi:MAG: DegT/DnrJ/EryC1/StrS family aminotransferase [bacterium]